MATLKIEGLDKLEKALKKNVTMDDVKRVVRHNGSQMQKQMMENADFTRGYQTGTTKRSIGLEITDGGFTAEVEPGTDYSPCSKIGRSIWQHMLENRAKSVKILSVAHWS